MDESPSPWWSPRELPGVEVLSPRATKHNCPRFTLHSGYAITITRTGAPRRIRYRGRERSVGTTGTVTVVEPDEVVEALDTRAGSLHISVLVVPPELLPDVTGHSKPPRFPRFTYADRGLFNGFARLHDDLARGADRLTVQSTFTALVDVLVRRHAAAPDATPDPLRPRALRQVHQVLHDCLDANISLDELAAVAGCGRHHLVRSFRQAYGAPPHRYRTLLRLARARSMLAAGHSAADVAAALGYFDQSQLNRHFRQELGTSAGGYARAVRR
ncbi:AraC family transcriptional regulator [Goodfellowiella coeruleoviolacea]|uniref:AraC-type DNA-binding protein n=1 Tax=Goodfellowiella coeruleoviolacea TaxID=334858 RepID=A0AAE3KJK4_9PSEU|nr:AraC family transcriptional regulator [Goodfellowiella coeruleoviolacea]MCP2168484.1 AraC-type DNA-binding protein [Goodfellowiella coeruleoviolacea]